MFHVWPYSRKSGRFLAQTIVLVFGVCATPPPLIAQEPEPFRREDVIEGRDFEYNEWSFIHRFSYRFRPGWRRQWYEDKNGFHITAGSVRSSELWVVHHLRVKIPFNESFYGELHARRDEDFDSRYDRFLTGVGVNFVEDWSVIAMGDITAEKEDVDLHLELRRSDEEGNRLRIAFIITDLFYNEKNDDDGEYSQRPFTYFASARLLGPKDMEFIGWVNANPDTNLKFERDKSEFSYDNFSGGLEWFIPIAETWQTILSLEAETGSRVFTGEDPEFTQGRDADREHVAATIELNKDLLPELDLWGGFRYFYLSETDRRPNDLVRNGEITRREYMMYGGVLWDIYENWTIWPGGYLNLQNNRDDFPDNEGLDSSDDSVIAKITMPVEYHFSEKASATFNLSAKIPDGPFGGVNVQFLILF